jgi:glucose-6-phosphate dehydrogenase assembly protein OpcA
VAQPVRLDSWSDTGVRLSDVIKAIGELRDSSSDRRSTRTAVMTVVAVAPSDEQAYDATEVLRNLASHHPARIILLRPAPDDAAGLAAKATLWALPADHSQVFEEVELDVAGQAARHLDSLVEALTLSGLPVTVWYVSALPEPSDPLLDVASAVLVDSRDAADADDLRGLLRLARRRVLVDLSWTRLQPVRELLAAQFDPPANRPWLDHIASVEAAGKPGPRRLLAGWVAAAAGVPGRRVHLTDAQHVFLRLTAKDGDKEATFTVERVPGQRRVVAEGVLPAGMFTRSSADLPADQLATSVASALTHLRADPVWERAVATATALDV